MKDYKTHFLVPSEALQKLKKTHDPQFFSLIETKKIEEKLEIVRRKVKFEKACYVEPEGLSEGLALQWKEQVGVQVIGKCKNLIDMEVLDVGTGQHFRIFWIYGHTDYGERQEVWNLICEWAKNIDITWMCVGDFNEILYNNEKEGVRATMKIMGFRQMIQ